jgi:choline dehydrogenase-like flavoprotein
MAHASREVILCAGVFGSPILLFKSGIGPSKLLSQSKIRSIADLPVGKTLQDQPLIQFGPFNISDPSKLFSINNNLTQADFKKYLKHKVEHVLSETGSGPQAFIISSISTKNGQSNWPDIQLVHSDYSPNQFSLLIAAGRPTSLGWVKLNTTAYKRGVRDNEKLAIINYRLLKRRQDYKLLKIGKINTIIVTRTMLLIIAIA